MDGPCWYGTIDPRHLERMSYSVPDMLWTAPEFLRMDKPPVAGNEKGDVYSFSIILQELFDLEKPYWRESLPAEGEKPV